MNGSNHKQELIEFGFTSLIATALKNTLTSDMHEPKTTHMSG